MLSLNTLIPITMLVAWFLPRLFWPFRYPDWFSVGLMAVFSNFFTLMFIIAVLFDAGFVFSNGLEESYFGLEREWAITIALTFQIVLIGISVISGLRFARHLADGGDRIGTVVLKYLGWTVGFSLKKLSNWIRLRTGASK